MIPNLTEREADIMRLREEGLSLAAVARELGTSKGSVASSERAAKIKMATPDLSLAAFLPFLAVLSSSRQLSMN